MSKRDMKDFLFQRPLQDADKISEAKKRINNFNIVLDWLLHESIDHKKVTVDADTDWDDLKDYSVYHFTSLAGPNAPVEEQMGNDTGIVICTSSGLGDKFQIAYTGRGAAFRSLHHSWFYIGQGIPADVDVNKLVDRETLNKILDNYYTKPQINSMNSEIHATLSSISNAYETKASASALDSANRQWTNKRVTTHIGSYYVRNMSGISGDNKELDPALVNVNSLASYNASNISYNSSFAVSESSSASSGITKNSNNISSIYSDIDLTGNGKDTNSASNYESFAIDSSSSFAVDPNFNLDKSYVGSGSYSDIALSNVSYDRIESRKSSSISQVGSLAELNYHNGLSLSDYTFDATHTNITSHTTTETSAKNLDFGGYTLEAAPDSTIPLDDAGTNVTYNVIASDDSVPGGNVTAIWTPGEINPSVAANQNLYTVPADEGLSNSVMPDSDYNYNSYFVSASPAFKAYAIPPASGSWTTDAYTQASAEQSNISSAMSLIAAGKADQYQITSSYSGSMPDSSISYFHSAMGDIISSPKTSVPGLPSGTVRVDQYAHVDSQSDPNKYYYPVYFVSTNGGFKTFYFHANGSTIHNSVVKHGEPLKETVIGNHTEIKSLEEARPNKQAGFQDFASQSSYSLSSLSNFHYPHAHIIKKSQVSSSTGSIYANASNISFAISAESYLNGSLSSSASSYNSSLTTGVQYWDNDLDDRGGLGYEQLSFVDNSLWAVGSLSSSRSWRQPATVGSLYQNTSNIAIIAGAFNSAENHRNSLFSYLDSRATSNRTNITLNSDSIVTNETSIASNANELEDISVSSVSMYTSLNTKNGVTDYASRLSYNDDYNYLYGTLRPRNTGVIYQNGANIDTLASAHDSNSSEIQSLSDSAHIDYRTNSQIAVSNSANASNSVQSLMNYDIYSESMFSLTSDGNSLGSSNDSSVEYLGPIYQNNENISILAEEHNSNSSSISSLSNHVNQVSSNASNSVQSLMYSGDMPEDMFSLSSNGDYVEPQDSLIGNLDTNSLGPVYQNNENISILAQMHNSNSSNISSLVGSVNQVSFNASNSASSAYSNASSYASSIVTPVSQTAGSAFNKANSLSSELNMGNSSYNSYSDSSSYYNSAVGNTGVTIRGSYLDELATSSTVSTTPQLAKLNYNNLNALNSYTFDATHDGVHGITSSVDRYTKVDYDAVGIIKNGDYTKYYTDENVDDNATDSVAGDYTVLRIGASQWAYNGNTDDIVFCDNFRHKTGGRAPFVNFAGKTVDNGDVNLYDIPDKNTDVETEEVNDTNVSQNDTKYINSIKKYKENISNAVQLISNGSAAKYKVSTSSKHAYFYRDKKNRLCLNVDMNRPIYIVSSDDTPINKLVLRTSTTPFHKTTLVGTPLKLVVDSLKDEVSHLYNEVFGGD